MQGLINRAIECFVRDTYGEKSWCDIAQRAGLGFTEFEAMLCYDAQITTDVLAAASAVLNRPRTEILEDIGTYLVSNAKNEAPRRLLRFGGENFVDFLHSLDDLPDRARLAVSDLSLPGLELREHATNHFSLTCQSGMTGYGYVLMGVLRTMADDYGALALLAHQGNAHGVDIISITLIADGHSDGRTFELGRRIA
jgi:hypothetical protein